MKSYLIPTLALGLFVGSVQAQDKPDLSNPKTRASYAIGVNMGSNFKASDIDLDVKALSAGITDAMADKPALTQAEVRETLQKFQQDLMAKKEAKDKVDAEKNLKAGEAFLAENGKKEGVKTLTDGLQYKVIKSGTGAMPKLTDTVKVNYHGTLIDGTVFDSSVDRGEPVTFQLSRVIPGWTEALQLMKVGDKWRLFIPVQTGLRPELGRPQDRTQQHADLRRGIARHREADPRRDAAVRKSPFCMTGLVHSRPVFFGLRTGSFYRGWRGLLGWGAGKGIGEVTWPF